MSEDMSPICLSVSFDNGTKDISFSALSPSIDLTISLQVDKTIPDTYISNDDDAKTVTNLCLFEFLINGGFMLHTSSCETRNALIIYLRHKLGNKCNLEMDEFEKRIKGKIEGFCSTLHKKWKESNRCTERFVAKNENWLKLCFNTSDLNNIQVGSSGRPRKLFKDLSERSKRRYVENVKATTSSEELIYATKSVLYTEGKRAAADLLNQSTSTSPGRALKIKKTYLNAQKSRITITPYTGDEALAYIIDSRITKNAYQQTRIGAKQRGANIYPSYKRIIESKQRCYPEGINVNEISASIPLQQLLDHTTRRLCEILDFFQYNNTFKNSENCCEVEFIFKWGCDGSSGHSEYQQAFSGNEIEMESNVFNNTSVFMFCLVPLKLILHTNLNENNILWLNTKPSSTSYCRPIKFFFEKETTNNILKYVKDVENEISNLKQLEIKINDDLVNVRYTMIFSMVDGKVINALTNTSSATCFICKCNPTNMNKLNNMHVFKINEDNLKYGLSSLHLWIKCLEWILHISYRLNSAETTKRLSEEQTILVSQRKDVIQKRFWNEMGLKVDKVTQGSGTSNTGNVARRFFNNPEKVADITGINLELINRISTILSVISSGHEIDTEKFDNYAKMTAQLYVELYDWYRMPPSVHKVLIHGALVIKYSLLPIGFLSEEAQESRNKDYKRYREHHTRKSSRINTNLDLLHFLLISSDPLITSKRTLTKMSKTELSTDALNLIDFSKETNQESDSETDSGTDSE
ncbi:hypothetical protein QTP88_022062 [Uroleucon formosanum]